MRESIKYSLPHGQWQHWSGVLSPRAGNGGGFMRGGSLQVGIQGQLNGWFKGYKICMMSPSSSLLHHACHWKDKLASDLKRDKLIVKNKNTTASLDPCLCFSLQNTSYSLKLAQLLPVSLYFNDHSNGAHQKTCKLVVTKFTTFVHFKDFWRPRWTERKYWFTFIHAVTQGLPIFSFIFKDHLSWGFFPSLSSLLGTYFSFFFLHSICTHFRPISESLLDPENCNAAIDHSCWIIALTKLLK